ncbi:NACHT, LRR and PYD domains-containing protein 3-like [Pristis pectinata]|uniref:NACHT, LRR and PYD domains-containing protein 3-like n=1 Tax=Pristis pectinata TaxID=685728 RepID=UPI00223E67D8|nr:NACHT, LRR and PYD domains-containing protein 3-like [Pristis pectinata]
MNGLNQKSTPKKKEPACQSGSHNDVSTVLEHTKECSQRRSGTQTRGVFAHVFEASRRIFDHIKDDGQHIAARDERGTAPFADRVKGPYRKREQGSSIEKESTSGLDTNSQPDTSNSEREEGDPTTSRTSSDGSRSCTVPAQRNPVASENKGPTSGCSSADGDREKLKDFLKSLNDKNLRRITEFYRQRLEDATATFADSIAEALQNKLIIDAGELERVRDMMRKEREAEASKYLFNRVMDKGSKAGRAFWEILVDIQDDKPKLKGILKEIQEKDSTLLQDVVWSQRPANIPQCLKEIQMRHKETVRQECANTEVNFGGKTNSFLLEDRYTELVIMKRPLESNIVQHELWARGRTHEKWQKKRMADLQEKITIDKLFRSSYCRTSLHGTSVVTGVAGIGKTTLVQKIAMDWAAGEIYQQFNFIFIFKFRNLRRISGRKSLKQLVLDSYSYFGKDLETVWKEPDKILFIFDGLDEFHQKIDFHDQRRDVAPEHRCFDPECQVEVADVVRCLVGGKLLRGCSVLITSRPNALQSLDKSNVSLWVEIAGFLEKERKEFCRRFCGEGAGAEGLIQCMEENSVLYTMCYIPVYCWIFCYTMAPILRGESVKGKQIPKTITELYSNFMSGLLTREGCDVENRRELLVKLGKMAYDGVCRNTLIFHQRDFERHGLQPSRFTSGFIVQTFHDGHSAENALYTFTHLTLQEFLAALSLVLSSEEPNMRMVLKEAAKDICGQFQIFLRFLAGLSSPKSTRNLTQNLGSFCAPVCHQVIDWLEQLFEQNVAKCDGQDKKTELMETFHLLYESQNLPLTGKLLGPVKKIGFPGLELSPADCLVLASVLKPCASLDEFDLTQCSVQGEGIRKLAGVLRKCKILRINENKLEDEGVKRICAELREPDCKIETLELRCNNLTHDSVNHLAEVISKNGSLLSLDLGNSNSSSKLSNDLTDQCIPALQRLIKDSRQLGEIRLSNTYFTEDGRKRLGHQTNSARCRVTFESS